MMDQEYILENNVMPSVKQAIHLGIIRTNTLANNMTVNVEENIKKSRRSAYGLFGGGFHGNNGLDPETLIHLFNTYITPVLMYGMELIIPKTTALEQLEAHSCAILIMTCVSCSRILISATSSAHALALQFTFPIFIPRYESLRLFNRGFM
jgi:hypothetical protein